MRFYFERLYIWNRFASTSLFISVFGRSSVAKTHQKVSVFMPKHFTLVDGKCGAGIPRYGGLLNGFLSHEMYNLLFWSSNVFQAEMLNWYSSQYKLTKVRLLLLLRKIHIGEKTGTPCFPPDPTLSTIRDPGPAFSTNPDRYVFYDNKLSNYPLSLVDALYKL